MAQELQKLFFSGAAPVLASTYVHGRVPGHRRALPGSQISGSRRALDSVRDQARSLVTFDYLIKSNIGDMDAAVASSG
ncbi:hypothetical protein N7535_005121 [Penicillium sp. DV-2018c]|nr:hypothetical protein N7461_008700 [Penicillium sp. DV-2018c]KAJ5571461.1 hypothetical protein N7535_005121 [Penicillium sp. DV-2018c]